MQVVIEGVSIGQDSCSSIACNMVSDIASRRCINAIPSFVKSREIPQPTANMGDPDDSHMATLYDVAEV